METSTDSGIAAVFSRVLDLGTYGLQRALDKEFPQPWYVNDPASAQWTVGPQGQLYARGSPAVVASAPGAINPLFVALGVAVLGGLVLIALK